MKKQFLLTAVIILISVQNSLFGNNISSVISGPVTSFFDGDKKIAEWKYNDDDKTVVKSGAVINGAVDTLYKEEGTWGEHRYKAGINYSGNAIANGTVRWYFDGGKINLEIDYSGGKKNGTYKRYYTNGLLSEKCSYINDRIEGLFFDYDGSGNLQATYEYSNGVKNGEAKYYDAKGVLLRKEHYDKGNLRTNDFVFTIGSTDYRLYEGSFKPKDYLSAAAEYGLPEKPGISCLEIDSMDIFFRDGKEIARWYTDLDGKRVKQGALISGNVYTVFCEIAKVLSGMVTYDAGGIADGVVSKKLVKKTPNYIVHMETDETHYKNGVEEGECRQYDRNGELVKSGMYRAGKPDGMWKEYSGSGKVNKEIPYDNGKLNGTVREYNGDKIFNEQVYNEGNLEEIHYFGEYHYATEKFRNGYFYRHIDYDRKGNITQDKDYSADKNKSGLKEPDAGKFKKGMEISLENKDVTAGYRLDNTVMFYYNGVTLGSYTYDDKGEVVKREAVSMDGEVKVYAQNGELLEKSGYKDDLKDGDSVEYNPGGTISKKVSFSKGVLNGPFEYFDKDGDKTQDGRFKDGQYDGEVNFYNPDGSLKRKTVYKDGYAYTDVKYDMDTGKVTKEVSLEGAPSYVAPEEGLKNGPEKTYHGNGKLKSEYNYKDGEKNGSYSEYSSKGKLLAGGSFKNDKLDGLNTWYNNDGILKRTAYFKEGKPYGEERLYNEKGKLSEVHNYKDGMLDGPSTYYNDEGGLSSEENYSAGLKDGKRVSYYQDSINEENYKAGKRDGVSRSYGADKKLITEVNYVNDRLEGEYREYYPGSGALKSVRNCVNNDSNGPYIMYYENGNKMQEGDSKRGYQLMAYRIGTEKQYYQDGKLKQETTFNNNGKMVSRAVYYPSGAIKENGNFGKDNDLQGIYTTYFENGNKRTESLYAHDVLLSTSTFDNSGNVISREGY